ncbi:ribonuclease H1-like [Leptopilina boulardi]|uniref:ribonuclease H1-like n=1 Tax=Leptopilina boulardi TaxID=63433 RepID=UPI0021F66FBF|nr:ribonuclease H1-like [Leptopilina boulardi]
MSHYGLQTDNEGYVIVYTDGCCTNNGYSGARAGIGVFFSDGNHLNVSEPLIGRATNQRAELHAVIAACKQALGAGIRKLQINTDSHYTMNCATKWVNDWLNNGWINARGNPVSNKSDIQEMLSLVDQLRVKWITVPAHSGIYGNVQADRLANQGAAKY